MKITTQCVLDTTMHKQTQKNVNKTWVPYKALEIKTNRTSFLFQLEYNLSGVYGWLLLLTLFKLFQSYTNFVGYLATQLPLSDTKVDFWTMIRDHSSSTIVLILNDSKEVYNHKQLTRHTVNFCENFRWLKLNVFRNMGN